MVDHGAKSLELREHVVVELGKSGDGLLNHAHHLNALDGVDAEVVFEAHVELEHVERVARLLGDGGEDRALHIHRCCGGD